MLTKIFLLIKIFTRKMLVKITTEIVLNMPCGQVVMAVAINIIAIK